MKYLKYFESEALYNSDISLVDKVRKSKLINMNQLDVDRIEQIISRHNAGNYTYELSNKGDMIIFSKNKGLIKNKFKIEKYNDDYFIFSRYTTTPNTHKIFVIDGWDGVEQVIEMIFKR